MWNHPWNIRMEFPELRFGSCNFLSNRRTRLLSPATYMSIGRSSSRITRFIRINRHIHISLENRTWHLTLYALHDNPEQSYACTSWIYGPLTTGPDECTIICWFKTWWGHQMKTFSALLTLCAGNSPVTAQKGQWHGAWMFSLVCAWINGWVNSDEADDLRRHGAHYDVIVMTQAVAMAINRSGWYKVS